MPDESHFLDNIRESRLDDSGPRLVYADWLEENGQELKAEMVRLLEEAMRMRQAHGLSREHVCVSWMYEPSGECDHCDYCRVMTRARVLRERGIGGIYD